MDRLGFGFSSACSLISTRPHGLIYAEANAFGFSGPYAAAGGYEHLGHFLTGIGMTQGAYQKYDDGVERPNKPCAVPINVLDVTTGHVGSGSVACRFESRADGPVSIIRHSQWAPSKPSASAQTPAARTSCKPLSCRWE